MPYDDEEENEDDEEGEEEIDEEGELEMDDIEEYGEEEEESKMSDLVLPPPVPGAEGALPVALPPALNQDIDLGDEEDDYDQEDGEEGEDDEYDDESYNEEIDDEEDHEEIYIGRNPSHLDQLSHIGGAPVIGGP